MGRIPDRWKDYTGAGKPVENVPIFACKTPLANKYSYQPHQNTEYIEDQNKFTPADLYEHINDIGFEIVVVIDLTNTFRYYNGVEEFGKVYNIQYEKVKCEGRKVPNDTVMERVANILSDVIYQHGKESKKVVGIHCTHGVNRTGYIVARYLIEWLGYEPEKAIEAFNVSRGHQIEREAYIEDLNKRTPELKFDKWKEERKHMESLNGMRDPMTLWTDFGDNSEDITTDPLLNEPADENKFHRFHPYSHRHNHSISHDEQQYWPNYPPTANVYSQRHLRPPFYRGKWHRNKKEALLRNDRFYEDDYTLLSGKRNGACFNNQLEDNTDEPKA